MLAFFAATCLATSDPAALLEANRNAMATASMGTLKRTYRYSSEGMEGVSSSIVDLASGSFVERHQSGLSTDAEGFDGTTPWMQDLSGFYSPQTGGNKDALAIDQAYRNANLWWRKDRGGAAIRPAGCDTIEVTPRGGQAFSASFDPSTHLLSSVRETQTFGHVHETDFADYRRCGSLLVPGRIETVSDGDAATKQVSLLDQCSLGPASADSGFAMPARQPHDWHLPPSGIAAVAMRTRDPEVMIKARINGKGPFLFYLDSGGHDIISPRLAHELGIRIEGNGRSGGAGEKTVETGYAKVASIDAGGAVLRNQKMAVIETSPPKVVGELIGGVLGVEFFERFITRIDYAAHRVTFEDPHRFGPAERRLAGTAVPFRFYEHMPQVAGRFEDIPVRFDIDTGASDTLTLTRPFVERANLRSRYPNSVHLVTGWGTGGPSYAWLARASRLALGPAEVARPLVSLSTASAGSFSDSAYDGNIGNGTLRHFTVTFDYPDRLIYLARVAHPDLEANNFDRTGMKLIIGDGGLQVMNVGPGTPASEAGLQNGDIVTKIAGRDVVRRPLRETRWMLKQIAPGKPISIAYRRNSVARTTTLVPRELVPE